MKTVFAAVFVACLLFLPSTTRADILAGPVTNATTGHIYYLLTGNTWTASEDEARVLGGHLVTIDDAAENAWVAETFFPRTGVSFCSLWIGLNDAASEGHFVWASGEPVTFSYWFPGEPNNAEGAEDYASIRHPSNAPPYGSWNDLSDRSGIDPSQPTFGVVELGPCTPHRAQALAQVVNGFVIGAVLTDSGCGYTNPPIVLVQGGGGSGALARAVISNGVVTAIQIVRAGLGYTGTPRIVIASPSSVPSVGIAISRIKVTQNVVLGWKYVLESSPNGLDWSATGLPFVAEEESIVTEFSVENVGRLFRLRVVP
jgi:hypothetical protein